MYIVTGASSGIGRAVACELLERGLSVISVARRPIVCKKLSQYAEKHISIEADITTQQGLNALEAAVGNRTLKGIVHAAGTPVALSDYADLISENMNLDMLVHVVAPIAINNLLSRQLNSARILYIDSYSANAPRVGWSGYSIVKAAAQMAAKSAAAEIKHAHVIRVFPGGVRTPLVEAVLNSNSSSPTALAFRKIDADGALSEPAVIGTYLVNILVLATDAQLDEREYWDFNKDSDHLF